MFKSRPYDPDRADTRSAAQKAANQRNFRVFSLRGLASHKYLLTGARRDALVKLVDEELSLIGAKPQSQHEIDARAEREARWAAAEDDQPF